MMSGLALRPVWNGNFPYSVKKSLAGVPVPLAACFYVVLREMPVSSICSIACGVSGPRMKHRDTFLLPYKQAVEELKVKLRGLRTQFELQQKHSPIEFVTGRVKPVASILDKANKKGIPLDRWKRKCRILPALG